MKILLVEDDQSRVSKLSDRIDASRVEVHLTITKCASEARAVLRETEFDLLLLDINLPLRTGAAPSYEVSLDLIEELVEATTLNKPHHLIGITAYDDAFASVTEKFSERLWSLVRVDDMNDAWIDSIISVIRWIAAPREDSISFKTDVLVLAALPDPEMMAVHSLPWNWQPEAPADSTAFVREGSVTVDDETLCIVTSSIARMGMVAAATRLTKLISIYRPRICVMVGICAGLKDNTHIGDIIFADPVWDYQSGKWILDEGRKKFEIAPVQVAASEEVRACVEQMQRDAEWLRRIRDDWPIAQVKDLSLHIGPMASGSAVLADGETIAELQRTQQRQLFGIDMETFGHYFAASQAPSPKPLFCCFKSVCDFADSEKSDDGQKFASYTSAKALEHFVLHHFQRLR